jgi:hypothetical protein
VEIGFIYSDKDPRQRKAREFLDTYCQERGILARIVEAQEPVESPTLIIDGHTLTEMRQKPREAKPRMFPSIKDIAQAIERHAWSL